MGSISYTRGTVYNAASSTTLALDPEVNDALTDTYAFYFSPTLEDVGYAPFAVLGNTTKGVADAHLELTASDFAYLIDFSTNSGAVRLNGGENDDIIHGGKANDTLLGDDGNDALYGGQGNDRLEGGDGNDFYLVENAGDRVLEADDLGTDSVYATVSYALTAGQEVEFVYAAFGTGLRLTGNELDQAIIGGAGRDTLAGLGGRDKLTGGTGADTFVYKTLGDSAVASGNRDIITDFSEIQGDRIDLHTLDANLHLRGNQAFTFIGNQAFDGHAGELQAKISGANTLISGDVDGNGRADFAILLLGHQFLDKGDFLL